MEKWMEQDPAAAVRALTSPGGHVPMVRRTVRRWAAGQPDEVALFIESELKPGAAPDAAAMIAFARENLASYKCPRHVVFGELPKTSTGKIQKFQLREKARDLA